MSLWKFISADRLPTGVQLQTSVFPWYGAPYIDQTVASGGPLVEPGSRWIDETTGNSFMVVKAAAGLTIGQVVALQTPATDTVTAAGSTTSVINLTTGALTVNAEVGNYVFFANLASSTVIAARRIKANAAASLTVAITSSLIGNNQPDADVLPSVPANGSAVSIIRPWTVVVGTASLVPVGVALGTVTSGSFTIIQVGGLAMVEGSNSLANLVAGTPAAVTAAGIISGMIAQVTATPLVDLYGQGLNITPLASYASAGPVLIPCYLNTTGA
jgi:hypothetical protein